MGGTQFVVIAVLRRVRPRGATTLVKWLPILNAGCPGVFVLHPKRHVRTKRGDERESFADVNMLFDERVQGRPQPGHGMAPGMQSQAVCPLVAGMLTAAPRCDRLCLARLPRCPWRT